VKHVLVALLLVACSGTTQPVANKGSGSATVTPSAPKQLTLVEGTPQTLEDGTILRVSKVLYAHAKDDKNISMATFTVESGGKSTEVVIERVDAPASGDAGPWRITLESVDPYHQPSSATITVQRVR
jgi:hypothetical protein